VIVSGAAVILVFIIIVALTTLCCLRSRPCCGPGKYLKTEAQARREVNLIEETRTLLKGGSRTPITDEHRQKMRDKWGIGNNRPSDEDI